MLNITRHWGLMHRNVLSRSVLRTRKIPARTSGLIPHVQTRISRQVQRLHMRRASRSGEAVHKERTLSQRQNER